MVTEKIQLADLQGQGQGTGFQTDCYNNKPFILQDDQIRRKKIYICAFALVAFTSISSNYADDLGTAFAPSSFLSWADDNFQKSLQKSAESFLDKTVSEKIEHIGATLGVNILELAAILGVSRPTIYEWMETKEVTMRKKNQDRLNTIYEISNRWKDKNVGVLTYYLHKSLNTSNRTLFDLLKDDNLDIANISHYLDNIAQIILKKREANEAEETLLKKHGFKPVSSEDMEDRLNDIDFWDR